MNKLPRENKGFKSILMMVLAVIGSSVATLAISFKMQSSVSNEVKPVNRLPTEKITLETVAARGRLEPLGEVIYVSVPTLVQGARVEHLFVKQGQWVKKGEVIAILHNRDRLQAALNQAKSQVMLAKANLVKVKAGAKIGEINAQKAQISHIEAEIQGQKATQQATIKRIQAQLDNANTECHRYETLYEDGAISASDRDNMCVKAQIFQEQLIEAQTNRDRTITTLLQQLTEARSTLEKIAEVRPVDVAIAQAELNQAHTAVQQAQADLDLASVKAPQAGQILKIHTYAGEIVDQQGIVALGQTQQMYAIAEVYETDIEPIRLGQRAIVTSQGFQDQLNGTVDEIGSQIGKKDSLGTDPAADVDARVVEVKIRLDAAASQRVQGLTNLQVKVLIDLQSLEDVTS
ncbi:MAG: ABC exporter membrane fusion protein [Crocosphaera sp.]|nr:ABC exporter membrane fusion protein [Crocosphaera sp.]